MLLRCLPLLAAAGLAFAAAGSIHSNLTSWAEAVGDFRVSWDAANVPPLSVSPRN
jgi:hypothetical protein